MSLQAFCSLDLKLSVFCGIDSSNKPIFYIDTPSLSTFEPSNSVEVLVILRVTPTRRHSFGDDRNTTQITPEVYCNRKYGFVEECDVCRYEFPKKARAGEIRLIFWIFAPSDTGPGAASILSS